MNEPQPLPLWAIPFLLVFFAGFWMLVTGAIAELGGWGALARQYREPEGTPRNAVHSFSMATLSLRGGPLLMPSNYNNCVIAEIAPAGLHLRAWFLFRFRHPPLLIPWGQIEHFQPGRFLFWRTMTIHPRGTSIRIQLYGGAGRAVEAVWRQLAERAAQTAAV